jgi:hypothetical protein
VGDLFDRLELAPDEREGAVEADAAVEAGDG